MILRLPPEMDLQFYFSNVPSDSNWNRLVLIKNEISARNQRNPRRTDGELFEPSETWWIKTLQFLLEKSLPNCRSENERNILLCSSQASEIAECWSTHHLEWFHFWKFIQGMIFGPIVSERSTPYMVTIDFTGITVYRTFSLKSNTHLSQTFCFSKFPFFIT